MRVQFAVLSAFSLVLAAGAAHAASDYLIKFDGVDGESKASVSVSSVSSGATDIAPRDAASGLATGRRQSAPVAAPGPGRASSDAATGLPTGRRQFAPVAAPDVELVAAASQQAMGPMTLTFDKASPVLAKVCDSRTLARAELSSGGERFELVEATVSCPASSQATRASVVVTSGKVVSRGGHITLIR
jgi:hypothetical protein